MKITLADIKRVAKLPPKQDKHDAERERLILSMQSVLERFIEDAYLNDASNLGLQCCLKLGVTEVLAGEIVLNVDLIERGLERLGPFLRRDNEPTRLL